jgi:hypothetical protein
MRARWVIFAFEMAALAAAYVLIGFAFGWVIAVILGGGFVVVMGLTWFAVQRLKRRRSV